MVPRCCSTPGPVDFVRAIADERLRRKAKFVIREMDRMTYPEVDEYLKTGPKIVIVPVGATEQHGVHGALGTDTFAALAMSKSVAEKVNGLVAPALPYGQSSNHRHYAGYAGLRSATLVTILTEIVEALINQGFRTVLIISGHRGNDGPISLAATDAREAAVDRGFADAHVLHMSYQDANRGRLREVVPEFEHLREVDVAYGSDGHGGAMESSIAMTIAPEGFRLDKLEKPDSTLADKRRGYPFKSVLDIEEIAANGIFGNPLGTSEEFGHKLVERTAEKIAADLQRYLEEFGGSK